MMTIYTATGCNFVEKKLGGASTNVVGIFAGTSRRFLANNRAFRRRFRYQHDAERARLALRAAARRVVGVRGDSRLGGLGDVGDDVNVGQKVEQAALGGDGGALGEVGRHVGAEGNASDARDEAEVEQLHRLELSSRRDVQDEAAGALAAVADDAQTALDAEGLGDAERDGSESVRAEIVLAVGGSDEGERGCATRKGENEKHRLDKVAKSSDLAVHRRWRRRRCACVC